jgi:hypothetical protein
MRNKIYTKKGATEGEDLSLRNSSPTNFFTFGNFGDCSRQRSLIRVECEPTAPIYEANKKVNIN